MLEWADASRDAGLAELGTYPVSHFGCHGSSVSYEPLRSSVKLADHPLAVLDLLDVTLRGTRLAVLSACESGVSGLRVTGEMVGLWSGLLQAGFSGVVSTLWVVNDVKTMLLMTRFYELLFRERLVPALALRRAQLWLRDSSASARMSHFDAFAARFPSMPQLLQLRQQVASVSSCAHPSDWAAFVYTGA